MESDIVEGLQAAEIERLWAPAAEAPWFERRSGPQGQEQLYLRRVNGACVFLRPDNLCAIHGELGAEAKPGFCREFPFHAVEDRDGLALIVRPDCSGLHESLNDGPPVAEQVEGALALPRVAPRARFDPEQVEFLPGLGVSGQVWAACERQLILQLEQDPLPPRAAVARIRGRLYGWAERPSPAPIPERYDDAGRSAVQGLLQLTEQATRQAAKGSPAEAEFLERNARRLQAALEGWGPLGPLPQDSMDYLDLVLRTQLLGKQLVTRGFPSGLGLHLLGLHVVRAAASPGPLQLKELGPMLAEWYRFTSNSAVRRVLKMARPVLVQLFLDATPEEGS